MKSLKGKYLLLNIKKKVKTNPQPIKINILQPLIKQKKLEFLVEKSNELGVFSFTPIISTFINKNYFTKNGGCDNMSQNLGAQNLQILY